MIYQHKSNDLEVLADLLSQQLLELPAADPFRPEKVIVPNLDTSSWLKLRIAEKNGFAGNIQFLLPGEWLYQQIRTIHPDLPTKLPSDPEPMVWTIFELLNDPSFRKNIIKIDEYINAQPEENRETALVQVSKNIASLYDQYMLYRPELILKWDSGNHGEEDEEWQAALWSKMNKHWQRSFDKSLISHKALLYQQIVNKIEKGIKTSDEQLFLFNPGLIAQPIVDLIKKCGNHQNIWFYLIAPVAEKKVTEHPLLASWGEEVKSVNEQYQSDSFELSNHYKLSEPGNHLQQIQKSIVNQESDLNLNCNNEKLNGIDIRSCHSRLREVEVLYNYLIGLFENDNDLSPDEVLVVSPDMSQYESSVKAIFGHSDEYLPQIPFSIAGQSNTQFSLLERSIIRLLQIAESRFNAADILDFLALEPIRERLELTESDVSKIKQWIEDNHVYWGLDEHHREELNQPAENIQTWKSAIKRIWLGQLMSSSKGEFLNNTLLYDGLDSSSDQLIWSRFTKFLSQLELIRNQVKVKHTALEWSDRVFQWLNIFFSERELASESAANVIKLFQDFQGNLKLSGTSTKISYSVIRQELEKKLNVKRSGSAKLNRGVMFSNMVPVRSLPFKVIALLGLNEDVFPRKLTSSDYDLMIQNPKSTDRNRRNEDRNLFLESILAAKDWHYCSYIGQDRVDNESLPPSPVVSDWIDYLSKVSGIEEKDLIKKESISSFSPNAYLEGGYESLNSISAKKISLSKNETEGLKINPLPGQRNEVIILSPSEFSAFFSNPARSYLRNNYQVRLRDPDDEPDEFELNHLDKYKMFIQIFGWLIEGFPESEIISLFRQSGKIPLGWKGDSEIKKLINNADKTIQIIKHHGFTPYYNRVSVEIELDDLSIAGEIQTFSRDDKLDISFSHKSGKNLMSSWVKHLLMLANNGTNTASHLLCEPKKGDPKLIRFNPVDEPRDLLNKLAKIYKKGQAYPVWFFPKTVYQYESNLVKSESKAFDEARKAFEGNDTEFSYPENGDLNLSFLLGENPEFRDEYVNEPMRDIVRQMMDHMEEVE